MILVSAQVPLGLIRFLNLLRLGRAWEVWGLGLNNYPVHGNVNLYNYNAVEIQRVSTETMLRLVLILKTASFFIPEVSSEVNV